MRSLNATPKLVDVVVFSQNKKQNSLCVKLFILSHINAP